MDSGFDNHPAGNSAEAQKKITKFETTSGLQKKEYTHGKKKIWLFNDPHGHDLGLDQITKILEFQGKLDRNIYGECYHIAGKAVFEG